MSEPPKKSYGLVLKKKSTLGASAAPASLDDLAAAAVKKRPAAFADSDDDDNPAKDTKLSATQIRHKKQTALAHAKALAEDPSAFEYDDVYDGIVKEREQKLESQKAADKERKPKYIHNLIKHAKKRELEQVAREERQQMKEREEEAGQFADKETFVTGAYRKQMEEVELHKEEISRRDAIDAAQDVSKQNSTAGFYKHLLNDLARVPGTMDLKQEMADDYVEKEKDAESGEKEPSVKKSKKSGGEKGPKPAYRRRRDTTGSDDDEAAPHPHRSVKKEKKSIYSDDDEETAAPRRLEVQSGGGLSFPGRSRQRLETAQERARRRFTPSPPPGEKSAPSKAPRRRSPTPPLKDADAKRVEVKEEKEDPSYDPARVKKEKILFGVKKVSDEERLEKLRFIFARRNDEKAIEVYRKRYFERRAAGQIQPVR